MDGRFPKLRADLVVSRQSAAGDASRAVYVVKVGATGRFFRFGEAELAIARQLDGETALDTVRRRVEADLGAILENDTLAGFVGRLRDLGLLEDHDAAPGDASGVSGTTRRIRGNLLGLRLPLIDPDALLGRLAGRLGWCFTRAFVIATAALIVVAVAVAVANAGEVHRDLLRLRYGGALVLAWITLLVVTSLHELAHGVACKRFGGHVHEIGVMLLFFQPAMYCNVSDAWLFPDRAQRLWVTFAGAYFELVVWALATLAWRILDPHTTLGAVALVVMAACGVKTLFNLNPLIKLDGYYLLSDFLELPNLRARAFAYLRGRFGAALRGRVTAGAAGVGGVAPRDRRAYAAYGLLAGAFSGWLLFVVTRWFGTLLTDRYQGWGAILFAGIVSMLLPGRLRDRLRGVRRWVTTVADRRPRVGRAVAVGGAAAIVAAVLVLGRIELSIRGEFVIRPAHNADVRAGVEGIVAEIDVDEGDVVAAGQRIARLDDAEFRVALEKTRAEIAEKRARLRLAEAGPRHEEVALAQTEVEKARARLDYARNQRARSARLHERQFTSRQALDEAEELVSVREKELESAEGDLQVLLAGTRPEELEALRAEVARLEAEERHLEAQLRQLTVTSPIAGVLTTPKLREIVGRFVEKGELIAEVYAIDTVTAEIAVPEPDVSAIALGQRVALRARAFPGRGFVGTVVAIAPAVTKPKEEYMERTVTVTTRLDNPDHALKPRMTGNAKIYCGSRRVLDVVTRRLARYVRVEFWSWW